MPIYNSHISVPSFRRIGSHIKTTTTVKTNQNNTPTSIFNFEHGEMAMSMSRKRKFTGSRSAKRDSSPLSSRASSPKAPAVGAAPPSEITMKIESPPLVLYGPPKESTGALLSGLIHLKNEQKKDWASFTMTLEAETLSKRPAHSNCASCAVNTEVLKTWTFINTPTGAGIDLLSYPFSFLLPGTLPATNDNALTRISYCLSATATSSSGDELRLRHPLSVDRSILKGPDRHSVRVFPPTKLSATVKLPSVVHPGGDFPFDIRLDGVVNADRGTRWRLRKVSWRIEETAKAQSPACAAHMARQQGKGTCAHEDVRTIGSGEVKRGWKSDFDSGDGKVELEVMAGLPVHSAAACQLDVRASAVSVEHVMIVEMIVAEENQPAPGCSAVLPTGAARVLRMQFRLVVTGRSGLGISWDEEAPPMYEDVPASPPEYGIPGAGSQVSYADLPPA